MIPYDETEGMSASLIENTYHVSKAFAKNRKKI